MIYSQSLTALSQARGTNMKYNYDYAAEMDKIANSAEHKKLFGLEKTAFSREGSQEPSEVEAELNKLAEDGCKCDECEDDCDCDCHEGSKKEASEVSLEDAASILLDISSELEEQGHERLAAASIVLADNIIKEAAKKTDKSKSESKSKSSDKSKSGKKLTMKERMEKMRNAQGKGKKSKDKTKSDKKS